MNNELSARRQIISYKNISIVLIILLMLLRYPLLFAGSLNFISKSTALPIFLCGTYLCTGLFIYFNRTRMEDFFFTKGAIILFLLSPLGSLIHMPTDLSMWIRIFLSIGFTVLLFRAKDKSFRKIPAKKIVQNVLLTLFFCIAVPFIYRLIIGYEVSRFGPITLVYVVASICQQFSFAAVSEEPLFRGFLSGYLIKRGFKEWQTCLIISLLFFLGHLYYAGNGLQYWLLHPILNVILSFIALKTKSVSYSMAFHASANVLLDILRFVQF